jgi:alpha-D-xyloside xylohydrolase
VAEGVYAINVQADGRDATMVRFNFASDDGMYAGLGERFGGPSARGSVVAMQLHLGGTASGTNETHVPVPFFVSSRKYGVFVRSRNAGAFDVAATESTIVSATFETSSADLLLFTDPDPIRIVAKFTVQSGLPRLPPYWAHGHMQWRNEWRSRAELFEDARRLRAERIPTTTIWIDNPWQRSYNDAVFDSNRFADPDTIFTELAALGFKTLLWHTPYLDAVDNDGLISNPAEQLFTEFRDRNQLLKFGDPPQVFVSPANVGAPGGMDARGALIDFSVPSASNAWTERLRGVITGGARAFKLDYGEDVLAEAASIRPEWKFGDGSSDRTAHSRFASLYHQAYRDALDRFAGGDGFLLVRASSWGGQRVCDLIWPGDLDNDFRAGTGGAVGGLPAAVSGLMNLSVSGFPSFASDTGGYRGGRPTREVLLRWAEASALAPFMQLGGGGESHNPWSYDAEATALYRDLAKLHDALVPYWRMQAIAASRDGTPPIRPYCLLFSCSPSEQQSRYAYLIGDDLYAAPVTSAGVTQSEIAIPPGTWVHWVTRQVWTGPLITRVDTPLGQPVLFVRQGAIVPMLASDVQTLAPTVDPSIVDVTDRQTIVRARIIPAAARSITLDDDSTISASAMADGIRVRWRAGMRATELRAVIDWRHRDRVFAGNPTTVSIEGGATLTPAANADAVLNGCADCWYFDGREELLYLTLQSSGTAVVR